MRCMWTREKMSCVPDEPMSMPTETSSMWSCSQSESFSGSHSPKSSWSWSWSNSPSAWVWMPPSPMRWSCSVCFFAPMGSAMAAGLDLEALERLGREQLLGLEEALRQALLVVVAQDGRERLPVGREAVRPVVVAHQGARVLNVLREPGQHRLQRRGDVEVVVGLALRLHERLVERHRDPRMLLVDAALDGDRVHYREDPRLAVVRLLDLHVDLELALHPPAAGMVGRGHARGVESVDLAVAQHRRERVGLADLRHLDARRQLDLELLGAVGLLLAALVVRLAVHRHAVLVLQDAADPHRCGHLVLGVADLAAHEVLRLLDLRLRVHVDARVAEEARREHRDRDEMPLVLEERDRVRRQRHLRHVELAVPQHAKEGLLDGHVEVREVDAVGLDAALEQAARAVVVPATEGEPEPGHQ